MAATDHPQELRRRRDGVPKGMIGRKEDLGRLPTRVKPMEETVIFDGLIKRSNKPAVKSICAHGDGAEALAENIKKEGKKIGAILQRDVEEEIWTIKKILYSKDGNTNDALLESLRRLQRMEMTLDVLKATGIGKVVNGFPKCNMSKQICDLTSTITKSWMLLVDEQIKVNASAKRKLHQGYQRDENAKKQRTKEIVGL